MDSTAPCFVNVIVSYFDFTARGKILDSTTRCFVIGSTRLLSIAMDCHWIAIPPISSDILLKIVSSKMILMIIIMVMKVIILILNMMTMIIAFIQSLFSQPPTAAGGNHHLSGFCQNITIIFIITINTINVFLILNVVMILNNTKILFSKATTTKTSAISTEGYLLPS